MNAAVTSLKRHESHPAVRRSPSGSAVTLSCPVAADSLVVDRVPVGSQQPVGLAPSPARIRVGNPARQLADQLFRRMTPTAPAVIDS